MTPLDPHSLAITLARHPVAIRPLTPLDRGPDPEPVRDSWAAVLERHPLLKERVEAAREVRRA